MQVILLENISKLGKIGDQVNVKNGFGRNYLLKFNSSELITPLRYGLFPGGKKIRSKIIFDVGKIFKVNINTY